MATDNQEKKSLLNEVLTILTIISGIVGLFCVYSMISVIQLVHLEMGEGFGVLVILIISLLGLILSTIVLGVSMEHELKNRRLTIIPVALFSISLVLAFF